MNSIVTRAREFAIHAHRNHKRKYTNEPYFVHLEEVAKMVEAVGGTPEMIAAAYLHDSVEDVGVTLLEIMVEFGPQVMSLVEMLTDVSKPSDGNREIRKNIDFQHTAQASPNAKTIKLADLISNTGSIVQYDKDFAKVYLKEKERLLPMLKEGNVELFNKACDTLIQAKLALME